MIRRTFNTLRDNPVIYLMFAIPFVAMLLAFVPMMANMSNITEMMTYSFETGQEPGAEQLMPVFGSYMSTIGLSFLLSLVISFLVLPPALHKVYEACSDINEPGWYSRGLKRSWWKLFVAGMLLSAASSVVMLISAVFSVIPLIGPLVLLAVELALIVFTVILFTAVIAEEEFGKALGNTFNVGGRYFFKQLGVLALSMIPVILVIIIIVIVITTVVVPYTSAATPDTMIIDMMGKAMNWFWVVTAISTIYYIFGFAFVYTYSMHQYLDNKNPAFTAPQAQESSYSPAGFDTYNTYSPTENNNVKRTSGVKTTSGNLDDY